MGKDAFFEVAKILSAKMGVTLGEAQVLVFVGFWQKTNGDYHVGPFPEKMVDDGWVNEVFTTSSGMPKSDMQSMFRQGYLLPRKIQNEDGTNSCDHHWMRVSDSVELAIQRSFAELG